jgi:1-acyl-sn-glycerol-3-phosphate acyltransferase
MRSARSYTVSRRMFTPTEQLIGAIARGVNRRPALKRCSHAFLRRVGAPWVHYCSRNLLSVSNVEALTTLTALAPDRGVILATNHRSYADMYLLSSVLLPRCGWIERMYFPVRSEFVYDHIGGLLANALVAGMAMYPPVYRQPARRALNRDTVTFLVNELHRRGTLVGMHPEGRRSTTADPYTLLPAQPGLGEIVHRAQPLVIPAFIAGVPDDLLAGVRANFRGGGASATITITFGEPLTFDEYRDVPAGARTSLRIAEAIRATIERLGALDRERRSTPRDAGA